MTDPLRFGRQVDRAAARGERGLLGLVALFLLVSIALFTRPLWSPVPRTGVLVEVRGDVAAPGLYRVDPPTARAAVEAAGGPSEGITERPVRDGDALVVGPGGLRIVPMSDPLLVMLPVDVNTADAASLAAVPGVGEAVARRIVEDRIVNGPFEGLDGMTRVPGVGEGTVVALAPFATASWAPPSGPVDLNRATAAELERLPGIGPALAARIVASRTRLGPFESLRDLQRVDGIGPHTVDGLVDEAVAEAAP